MLFALPARPDKAADVYTMRIGGEPRRVTDFGSKGGRAIQPTWTPAGDRVVFVAEDTPGISPNAAFISPDGRSLTRLSKDRFVRTHPRLRPTP